MPCGVTVSECSCGGGSLGKSKRDEKQLRSLVWSQHLEGKSNRAIGRELKLCRNRVNELVKLGPPEEFKRKTEAKAGPLEPDWRKEKRLLAEVESRLPMEQRLNEAILKTYLDWLKEKERQRRQGFPFLPG